MDEHFYKTYRNEEEFLAMFGGFASAASDKLEGEWKPQYGADDTTRRKVKSLLSEKKLHYLAFVSANVFHNEDGFSSARIILVSSNRDVEMLVRKSNGKLLAEKTIDKLRDSRVHKSEKPIAN